MTTYFKIFILAIFVLVLTSCGGGGDGDTTTTSESSIDPVPDPAPEPDPVIDPSPAVSGFNFKLSQGDFWEYQWDGVKSVVDASGTSTKTDSGRLRLTLGTPVLINGINAYNLIVAGNSKQGSNDFLRPWKYIAINNNQILGSKDGAALEVLFDGMNGFWSGTGIFNYFSPNALVVATADNISNDYITSAAISVSNSSSTSQCEYFPGIGTLCTGDIDSTSIDKEYYLPNIGLAGSYYYSAVSYGGINPQSFVTKRNVGLVASSFLGDSVTDDLEIESNDSKTEAQIVKFRVPMTGYIQRNDSGTVELQVAGAAENPDQIVSDWYKIIVPSLGVGVVDSTNVVFDLTFPGTFSDLDLYIFDNTGTKIGESTADNLGTSIYSEKVARSLSSGTYYIGIHAWSTPERKAVYSLNVKTCVLRCI